MAEIDKFASLLLEEAKRFFERASETQESEAQAAYLHAALMVGFCSLEAHVNAVAEEVADRKGVTTHEKAVLLERRLQLDAGEFVDRGLQIYRLEDRLYLLHRRFGKSEFKKASAMSAQMTKASKLRNSITHPKNASSVAVAEVKDALEAIIDTIDKLCKAIFGRGLPAAARGLHSKMTF